jgi:hypothetical protein
VCAVTIVLAVALHRPEHPRYSALPLYLKLNRNNNGKKCLSAKKKKKSASIGTTMEDLASLSRCRRDDNMGREVVRRYDGNNIRREADVEVSETRSKRKRLGKFSVFFSNKEHDTWQHMIQMIDRTHNIY